MDYTKAHPLLHLPCTRVLYNGTVSKITRNGQKQTRILIVTNLGLFLLKKRTFPAGFNCSHAISYESIKLLNYKSEFFEFRAEKRIAIASTESSKIIALILQVRSLLFGDIDFKCESEKLKNEVQQNRSSIQTESPVADRFLARCINSITFNICDQVHEIYKQLKEIDGNSIVVTPETLSLPTSKAYIDTITAVTFPYELVISSGDYQSFIGVLSPILQNSDRVEKITFRDITFVKPISDDILFKGKNHQTSISAISLIRCDFRSPQIKNFLEDLIHYNGKIFSILCQDCKFTESTIQSFFNSLYDAKSVHEIEYFEVGGIEIYDLLQVLLIQFVNNTYVLTSKNLHKITVSNSKLDVNFVLNGITLFDTGIEEVCINGCQFEKPIESPGISNYFSINTLDFSQTRFNFESLTSLFHNIKQPISAIVLNQISIDQGDLKKFYCSLPDYDFPFIERFEFSNNHISEFDCVNLFEFITKMKSLSILALSNSIKATSESLNLLIKFISQKQTITVLKLKGLDETSFGEDFSSFIDKIPASVTDLDITGQKIGDDGMTNLTKVITRSLQSIRFGGTNCSIRTLCAVYEAIISSYVTSAEWNQAEVNASLARAADQTEWAGKVRQLKSQFEEKFGNSSSNSTSASNFMTSMTSLSRKVQLVDVGNDTNLKIKSTIDYRAAIKTNYDKQLLDMIEECVGREKTTMCQLENTLKLLEAETPFLINHPQAQQ